MGAHSNYDDDYVVEIGDHLIFQFLTILEISSR